MVPSKLMLFFRRTILLRDFLAGAVCRVSELGWSKALRALDRAGGKGKKQSC